MQSLTKFIREKNYQFDELFVNIEYDQITNNSTQLHLNESDAQYKGQFALSEFLTFEILKKHSTNITISFDKQDLEDNFDNIFFNKIVVKYIKMKNNSGGYKREDNEILIFINSEDNKRYENIFSCISHELKHAWQDYKNIYTSISNLSKTNLYLKSVENLSKSLAANIIYRCIKHEYDAFASEFSSEFKIEVYKNNPSSLQDCIKLARKTQVYDEIYKFYNICENLNKKEKYFNFTKDYILNEAKEILNKYISWEQFYKKYVNRLRKLFEKLCNIIANVYYMYIDEMEEQNSEISESIMIRPTRKYLIKLKREEIIYNDTFTRLSDQ